LKRALPHLALFLFLTGVYVVSGPGRIDIIDGQYRFEVTRNIVEIGRPVLRDPALDRGVYGPDGSHYSGYGPAASVAAVPLVAIAHAAAPGDRELAQFLFSFTSALLAALAMVLLFATYELFGIPRRRALAATLTVALATLMWPTATSTFDQAQQACAVIGALYAGRRAAAAESWRWAGIAGLAAGMIVAFQNVYIVLVPAGAFACTLDGERIVAFVRSRRFLAYAIAAAIGIACVVAYNVVRLGTLATEKNVSGVSPFGNPLIGALGLLVSPGKSVFLYSPPLVLAVIGWRRFRASQPGAARAALILIGVHFVVIACLTFWGGDWAWGPRYTVVTLPLVCLALPFVALPRVVTRGLIVLGVVVQLLAISVDHQRFFFERDLPPYFWASSRLYFHDSALFARPGELGSVLAQDNTEIRWFVPNPQHSATYTLYGPPAGFPAHRWMRAFALFYLPRPFPLWMRSLPDDEVPDGWQNVALGALLMLLVGGALLAWTGRRLKDEAA